MPLIPDTLEFATYCAFCAQYLVLEQVAQLAKTTCATNLVLPVSGTICTTSAKDIHMVGGS